MRIVLDTNILVRANPKVSAAGLARDLLLTIVSSNEHTLILSSAILVEVRRVLNYPHVQTRWPLTEEMIAQYAAFLEAAAFCVEVPESPPAVVVKDPDDDPILQTAILGHAPPCQHSGDSVPAMLIVRTIWLTSLPRVRHPNTG